MRVKFQNICIFIQTNVALGPIRYRFRGVTTMTIPAYMYLHGIVSVSYRIAGFIYPAGTITPVSMQSYNAFKDLM